MATATKTRKTFTADEKAAWKEERMAEQKQMLEDALAALSTQEAWQNWVRFGRSNLAKYSFNNALLIWSQNQKARLVRGWKQWQKEGVKMNEGAKPIRIFAPCFVNLLDANGNVVYDSNGKPKKRVGFFKVVSVYDVSETDAPQDNMADPMVELEGDDLADQLAPLERFAMELGFHVVYKPKSEMNGAHGWVDTRMYQIVMDESLSANALVRTLVHELCHAYGNVNYQDYSREEAEVLVESSTVMALSIIGFDTAESSVPYIASWGGDLKVLDKYAKLVDELVKTLTEKMGV